MSCNPIPVMTRKAGTYKSKVTGMQAKTPAFWTAYCRDPDCPDGTAPLWVDATAETSARQWCADHLKARAVA